MKRVLSGFLILLLAASLLAGCTGQAPAQQKPQRPSTAGREDVRADADAYSEEGTPLFTFLGGEMQAFARGFAENPPIAAGYRFDGEAGGEYAYVVDPEFVQLLFEAAANLRIGDDTGMYTSDSTAIYAFLMEDGTLYSFLLNGGNLEHNGKVYETVNQFRLKDFRFPGYQDTSVFYAYPDRAMYAFGEDFFDLSVIAVSCVSDGGEPVVIKDPDALKEAFLALSRAELCPARSYPAGGPDGASDVPARTVTFTLLDGSAYAFRFAGRNLAVDYPDPIRTQYFWLGEQIDKLFDLF